jgi:hypothetical protein
METRGPELKPSMQDVWMRGVFMLLLMAGFAIGQWLLNVLAVVQFLWLLFAREPNLGLASFGNAFSIWLAEVGRFLTCASEEKPFPWKPWPHEPGPAP